MSLRVRSLRHQGRPTVRAGQRARAGSDWTQLVLTRTYYLSNMRFASIDVSAWQDTVMASLDDVRTVALALPEVEEKLHFGMPAFRVADKGFASVTKDHRRLFLHLDVAHIEAELVRGDCQRLTRGTTLIGLDTDLVALDVDRLQRLLLAAWRHRAPKKVLGRHLS
jgi:hypothetical protein